MPSQSQGEIGSQLNDVRRSLRVNRQAQKDLLESLERLETEEDQLTKLQKELKKQYELAKNTKSYPPKMVAPHHPMIEMAKSQSDQITKAENDLTDYLLSQKS